NLLQPVLVLRPHIEARLDFPLLPRRNVQRWGGKTKGVEILATELAQTETVALSLIRHPGTDEVMLDHGYPAAQLFSGERRLRQVGERHLLVVLLRRGNRRPQVGLHAEAIPRRGLPGIPLDLAEQVAAPFLAGLVVDAV